MLGPQFVHILDQYFFARAFQQGHFLKHASNTHELSAPIPPYGYPFLGLAHDDSPQRKQSIVIQIPNHKVQ